MIAICFGIHLSFTMSSRLCVYLTLDSGVYIINVLNQRFYLATFVRLYLSSATFNTFNTIWNYATF